MNCPCNTTKKYSDCCKKAHNDIFSVTTAENLMRSRYSAFVLADIEYLQKSHHSKERPSRREKKEILRWTTSVSWMKLEILNTTSTTVEFKAHYLENGILKTIHENSYFTRENGHWVYVKGVHF